MTAAGLRFIIVEKTTAYPPANRRRCTIRCLLVASWLAVASAEAATSQELTEGNRQAVEVLEKWLADSRQEDLLAKAIADKIAQRISAIREGDFKGQALAKDHLSAGRVQLIELSPRRCGMGPPAALVSIYLNLERQRLRLGRIGFRAAKISSDDTEAMAFRTAYNDLMLKAIRERHGADIFETLWKEAERRWELEQRTIAFIPQPNWNQLWPCGLILLVGGLALHRVRRSRFRKGVHPANRAGISAV